MKKNESTASHNLEVALSRYIDGQAGFSDIEAALAESTRANPDQNEVFKRLYHVINHYELDTDLRREDPQYESAMTCKLRRILESLVSGRSDELSRSLDAFWKR